MSKYREPYVAPSDECYIQRRALTEKSEYSCPPPDGGGWEFAGCTVLSGPDLYRSGTILIFWRKRHA